MQCPVMLPNSTGILGLERAPLEAVCFPPISTALESPACTKPLWSASTSKDANSIPQLHWFGLQSVAANVTAT